MKKLLLLSSLSLLGITGIVFAKTPNTIGVNVYVQNNCKMSVQVSSSNSQCTNLTAGLNPNPGGLKPTIFTVYSPFKIKNCLYMLTYTINGQKKTFRQSV